MPALPVDAAVTDGLGQMCGADLVLTVQIGDGAGHPQDALMGAGALDGLAIGFRTVKDHFDRAKGVRYLDEVDVPEISIVTFPLNPRATVSTVKGHDPERARALVAAINRAKEALRA